MNEFIRTLLEASVTAGIAALAVIIIRAAMKKAPKRWVYALWAVVFFRCLCPFSIESSFSIFNAVKNVSENTAVYDRLSKAPDPEGNALPEENIRPEIGENYIQPSIPKVPKTINKKPVNKDAVLFAVWITGAAVIFIYSIISYIKLMSRLKTAVKTDEGIYESDRIPTAFSAGFFPPKIYLPRGLAEEEKALITAHERTHIKRLDYIAKPLAFLALTLHWFNPMIWLAFLLMTRDMELSCDEAVLGIFGEDKKTAYSEALLHISARQSGLSLPLAFAKTDIKDRVKNILKYKKPAVFVTVLAALAVIAACVILGTNAKTDKENEPDNMSAQQDNQRVYGSVTNLSINGNFPAYFACDLDETGETGTINFEAVPDGGSIMVTGFHDDNLFVFQNAYTGKTESVRLASYGDSDYLHILGMSTQNGAEVFASTVFDMKELDVKSIALEDMYTITDGDKLYLNIMLTFTSNSDEVFDVNSYPVSETPGSYSFDIVKGDAEGEYDLSLTVNYAPVNPFDCYAVVLCGFEEAEKYVAPKLILDHPDTDNSENAVDYENAVIQKVYVSSESSSVHIELFDEGFFRVTDFFSSYMPFPNPCKSYRYEDDILILGFDDDSELVFDVSGDKLFFNEKLSRKQDARSRDIPFFKDGAEFLLNEEWLDIEKQAAEERRLEAEKQRLEEE